MATPVTDRISELARMIVDEHIKRLDTEPEKKTGAAFLLQLSLLRDPAIWVKAIIAYLEMRDGGRIDTLHRNGL